MLINLFLKKEFFLVSIALIILISCTNNKQQEFQLRKGDFLFQDLDSDPLCDAIEIVTPGYKGANLSHLGIVVELGDPHCINPAYNYTNHIRILEAIPKKVKTTRLDSFLNRSFDNNKKPKVIVGRLKTQYHHIIEDAISYLKTKIGSEYDDEFLMNNNSYYCSELIYEAFKEDSIFELKPMTFLDPETKKPLDTWSDYYLSLGIDIPEGKLGINPGNMSLSNNIEIVHYYGNPSGFKE